MEMHTCGAHVFAGYVYGGRKLGSLTSLANACAGWLFKLRFVFRRAVSYDVAIYVNICEDLFL